jgi:hypothetical protein
MIKKPILFFIKTFCLLCLSIFFSNPIWSQPSKITWVRHIIDDSSKGADGIKLADINKDGRLDIATGWEEGNISKVYLHPSPKKVQEKWPSVKIGQTPSVEDATFIDMNADGQLDVVSCSEGNTRKIYVQYAPKRKWLQAKKWKQKILPASDGVQKWMYAIPMQVDQKNGMDLIAGGKAPKRGKKASIGWFEAPKSSKNINKWQWHPIGTISWIMSMMLQDMDQDGDLDIVITDRYGALQSCRWLENPNSEKLQKQRWKSHLIGAKNLEVMFMTIADLDQDNKAEVILVERTEQTIRIYKNTDNRGRNWQETVIRLPSNTGLAKSIEVGDINKDGSLDFVISSNTGKEAKHGLIWLDGSYLDKNTPPIFQTISGAHIAKYDRVELIDLDEDGDLDVLICEENYGKNSEGLGVIWYENRQ